MAPQLITDLENFTMDFKTFGFYAYQILEPQFLNEIQNLLSAERKTSDN